MNLNRRRRRKARINHFLWQRHTQRNHRRTFIRSLLDREATKTAENYRRVRCGCCEVMLQDGMLNVPSDLNWRKASFNRSIWFNHFNGIKFNYFQCSIGERENRTEITKAIRLKETRIRSDAASNWVKLLFAFHLHVDCSWRHFLWEIRVFCESSNDHWTDQ